MSKPQKKLVKKTVIPIRIDDNPKELRGVVRFSTEPFKSVITPMNCTAERKKSTIIYKNSNQGVKDNEDSDQEQDRRKKEIELYQVTLAPSRVKSKQFKVDIPINRGHKSIKASKANELYYTFYFNNTEGRIALLNGQYEAKMEMAGSKDKKELTSAQRMEAQLSKLDNRKKEVLGDMKPSKRSEDN